MRRSLAEFNVDLVKEHPDYVCRVTADEGEIGTFHRSRFQDVETRAPTILTTSQLLTAGVDAPTCKNVVLVRTVGSIEVAPFSEWGNVIEIAARFGGGDQLRGAVAELQRRLYVA